MMSFKLGFSSMAIFRKALLVCLPLAIALFLSACSKMPLYADLEEKQANEIAGHLIDRGVKCEKIPGNEGLWTLHVSQEDFAYAMAVLEALGLPREKFQGLGDVFPKGTFSSPNEDHYRYVNLREQQISSAILSNFPAVMSVSVNINLPQVDALSDKATVSAATVMLTYRPDYDFELVISDLKEAVANAVEGLKKESVMIVANPSDLMMPEPKPTTDDNLMAKIEALPPLGLAGGALVGGGLLTGLIIRLISRKKVASA